MGNRPFQDWITLAIGVLLAVVPLAVALPAPEGTSTMPLVLNFLVSGAAAIVLALAALFAFQRWEEWLGVAVGLWLIASPWVLDFTYAQDAVWAAVLGGGVIVAMGGWVLHDESAAEQA